MRSAATHGSEGATWKISETSLRVALLLKMRSTSSNRSFGETVDFCEFPALEQLAETADYIVGAIVLANNFL